MCTRTVETTDAMCAPGSGVGGTPAAHHLHIGIAAVHDGVESTARRGRRVEERPGRLWLTGDLEAVVGRVLACADQMLVLARRVFRARRCN
jgi:hypothetical protein